MSPDESSEEKVNPQDLWEGPPPECNRPRRSGNSRRPVATIVVCALSAVIFVQFAFILQGDVEKYNWLFSWLAGARGAVWEGRAWVYFTSTLVHVEIWHIAFNFLFLYYYGPLLERAIGSGRWVLFFLVAAFVSSGMQLAFSGDTGIGLSGVLYAFYGFMWISKVRYREFVAFFNPQMTIMPLAWLVMCIVMTFIGVMNIGNAAHVSGLILGVATAEIFVFKRHRALSWAAIAAMTAASAVVLFWCPWQGSWAGWQAMRAHKGKDLDAAMQWYDRSIARGYQVSWARHNQGLITAYRNQWERYEALLKRFRAEDPVGAGEMDGDAWDNVRKDTARQLGLPAGPLEFPDAPRLVKDAFEQTLFPNQLARVLLAGALGRKAKLLRPELERIARESADPDVRAAARLARERILSAVAAGAAKAETAPPREKGPG